MKEYKINIEGTDFNVVIGNVSDGAAEVEVNGEKYEVNFTGAQEEKSPITAEGFVPAAGVVKNGAEAQVTSPLPGIVVELCVKEGQAVRAGDKVAVVEAMKMENDIFAERDGTVGKVCVAKGDSVLEGAVLMTIE